MKTATIEGNKRINDGKKTEINYSISELDLEGQFREILNDEYYKPKYPDNDVCVDVGANIGLATLYLKNFCKSIYSIEPSPLAYEALNMNVGRFKNIKTFNHAIYTHNGEIALYGFNNEPPQTSHVGFYLNMEQNQTERIIVPCKTLGTFMEENKIKYIDVLKIDVEGSEYEIFCDNTFDEFKNKIGCIVGETHYLGEFGIPELARYLLESAGFKVEFLRGKRHPNVFKQGTYIDANGTTKRDILFPVWTNFIAWKKRK
jgi:FkbM family methyltransferase